MSQDTLKQRIYNRILEEIVTKKYPVDCILKEKELSEKFGASRAPVREALIELSKENIVKSIPRAGYRIVHFTAKDISEAMELRLILELSVLDTIIGSIRRESLQKLFAEVEKNIDLMHRGVIPPDVWWNNNIRFHVALNAEAGNSLLTSALESVLYRLWRAIAQFFWSGNSEDYLDLEPNKHLVLLRAIEEKNSTEARKILSEDTVSIRGLFEGRLSFHPK
ncbi:MAG: GntR family transcriptional regulator [Spirochaetaceae bacterium]|jgi:DNA-binding GntR family transcriptional regulator|nr:GntR family transcriptional regulator [Spirochaetaceae bacterium]